MTPEALAAFESKRLETQYGLFGKACLVGITEVTACLSAPRSSYRQVNNGYQPVCYRTARVRKSETDAAGLEKILPQSDFTDNAEKVWRITEVKDSQLGSEWILELEVF